MSKNVIKVPKKKAQFKAGDIVIFNPKHKHEIINLLWKKIHWDKAYQKAMEESSSLFGQAFIVSERKLLKPLPFSRGAKVSIDSYTLIKADDPTFEINGFPFHLLIEM